MMRIVHMGAGFDPVGGVGSRFWAIARRPKPLKDVLQQSARCLLFLACMGGCDPSWSITGSVRDEDGAPILGATVDTVCPKQRLSAPKAVSGEKGVLFSRGVGSFGEDCLVEIQAPGYVTQRVPVRTVCARSSATAGCLAIKVDAVLALAVSARPGSP